MLNCSPSDSEGPLHKDMSAVLFDMDGVLVDSEPIHEKAQNIVCQRFGIEVPKSVSRKFKGWTEDRVYKYIGANFGTGSSTVEELIQAKHTVFAELSDELYLMAGGTASPPNFI